HSENRIVQPGFKEFNKVFTCYTFPAGCFLKCFAELFFQYTIRVFSLLFFAKLESIFSQTFTFACSAMLTGRVAVFIQPFAIAQNRLTKNAGNLGLWTSVTCHSFYSFRFFLKR